MIIRSFLFATCFGFFVNFCAGEEDFFTINGKKVLNKVSEKFLSFTIDPVVLLTGLNLSDSSLQLAKHLSPAYIRIAGPSTEFVTYIDNEYELSENKNKTSNLLVTPSMWFGVNEWFALANLTPVFGINDIETEKGVWNAKETLPLFELSDKFNVTCYWQLGFDCSNKTESSYKEDLNTLHHVLEAFPDKSETWKIVGSDFSKCHSQEHLENAKKALQELDKVVDVVMWEPSMDDEVFPNKKDLMSKILNSSSNKIPVWTTAPKNTRPVSFSSAIQWGQQVGDAAKIGYDVILRQPRLHEMFSVTPVYWLSIVHKTLMGRVVLEAKKPFKSSNTYVFAQCTKKQNHFLRRGALSIMIINNETETYTAMVRLGNPYLKTVEVQTYLLTSPSEESTDVFLNGMKLEKHLLKQEKLTFPAKIRRANALKPIALEVPPKSISFFVLPGARIPACVKYEDSNDEIMEEIDEDQKIPLSEEIILEKKSIKPRSSFNSLKELQELLEKELESDENYYKISKNKRPDINLLKSRMIRPNDNKLTNEKPLGSARNFFIESAKMAEKLKRPKPSDFDSKFESLLGEISRLKESVNSDYLETPKSKVTSLDLTSSEIQRIMKDRVRLKAARKNVKFTSKELDELMSRGHKKLFKFKRSIPGTKWDFNSKLNLKKDDYLRKTSDLKSMIEEKRLDLLDKTNNIQSKLEERKNELSKKVEDLNLKVGDLKSKYQPHWRHRRGIDYESQWNDLKERLGGKKQNTFGGFDINDIMSKFEEQKEKIKTKLEFDVLQSKLEDAREKILGAVNIDDWKSKLEETKDKLLGSATLDDLKSKFSDAISKWDDYKENTFGNSKQRFKRSADSSDKLGKLKAKIEHQKEVWKSPMVIINRLKQNNLKKRVKKDINLKMLNLKSQMESTKAPPQMYPLHYMLPPLKKPLEISPRTSEEFMSSSDEFNFNFDKPTDLAPAKRKPANVLNIFGFPRPKPNPFLPTKPKVKMADDRKLQDLSESKFHKDPHPCEQEIFGTGLAQVSGDDLWHHSTDNKIKDCLQYFAEKNAHNDDFIKSLSDYMKDPQGMQEREDDINLSLDDDDFGHIFDNFRGRRDADVTPEDIENYKLKLQKIIEDLQQVIKQDRKKILQDKVRYQEEKKKALVEKIIKPLSVEVIEQDKRTGVPNVEENEKIKKLMALKEKLLSSVKNNDDLKQKIEQIKGKLNKKNEKEVVKSRQTDIIDDITKPLDILMPNDILGEIEEKRKQLQIKSDLIEIDMLKKRLERRQKLLDKLTEGTNYTSETATNQNFATEAPNVTINTLIDSNVESITGPSEPEILSNPDDATTVGKENVNNETETNQFPIADNPLTVSNMNDSKTIKEAVGDPQANIMIDGNATLQTSTETNALEEIPEKTTLENILRKPDVQLGPLQSLQAKEENRNIIDLGITNVTEKVLHSTLGAPEIIQTTEGGIVIFSNVPQETSTVKYSGNSLIFNTNMTDDANKSSAKENILDKFEASEAYPYANVKLSDTNQTKLEENSTTEYENVTGSDIVGSSRNEFQEIYNVDDNQTSKNETDNGNYAEDKINVESNTSKNINDSSSGIMEEINEGNQSNGKEVNITLVNNGKFTENKITVESNNNKTITDLNVGKVSPIIFIKPTEVNGQESLVDKLANMETRVEEAMDKKLEENAEDKPSIKKLTDMEIKIAEDLGNKLNIKRKRSVSIFGKTFGDYQSKTANLKKWKPSDILSLKRVTVNNRNNFKPIDDNNIFKSLSGYNRNNNNFKSKRSVDIDVDSTENEVDSFLNSIDRDFSPDLDILDNRFKNTDTEKYDNVLSISKEKFSDSYDGEDFSKTSKDSEFPTVSYTDKKKDKLISYEDKMTYGGNQIKKNVNKPQSYNNIQKILPREEQKAITQFFDNLTGLLQSIGKKLETSFKNMFF